jgi:dTDP-4-amino-4,6-dideoxygalactose transaminase
MIPFNKPFMTGKELWYIAKAHSQGHLAGDGSFTKLCNQWIESRTGSAKALLTHSCTAALEMAALLAGIERGDEVIMPSHLRLGRERACCAARCRYSWTSAPTH